MVLVGLIWEDGMLEWMSEPGPTAGGGLEGTFSGWWLLVAAGRREVEVRGRYALEYRLPRPIVAVRVNIGSRQLSEAVKSKVIDCCSGKQS